MTDTTAPTPLIAAAPHPIPISRRAVLIAAVVVAAGAGTLATSPDAAAAAIQNAGHELTMLLRFMAAVKAIMALAAVAATFWRLGYPASPMLAAGYLGSTALMSIAPVLIWQIAHVALGAALFHAGLLLLLVALFADRGEVSAMAQGALRRHRA